MTEKSGTVRVPWFEDHTEEEDQHISISWTRDEHNVNFKVFELYEERGEVKTNDVAEGYLKWDGCLNITFCGERNYFHFCGPEEDPLLGRIIKAIYSLGPKIPNWDA